MKIEEGNGAWLLVNAEGLEIARRRSRDDLQRHWDSLSAARAFCILKWVTKAARWLSGMGLIKRR